MGACLPKSKVVMNEDEYALYLRLYKYLYKNQGRFEVATYRLTTGRKLWAKRFISNSEVDAYNSQMMYREVCLLLGECNENITLTNMINNQFTIDIKFDTCDKTIITLYKGLN